MKKFLIVLFVITTCIACKKEANEEDDFNVDIETFDQIIRGFEYSGLRVRKEIHYWEYINGGEAIEQELIFSEGTLYDSGSVTCPDNYNTITNTERGYGTYCLPGDCYRYFKYQEENMTKFARDLEEIMDFIDVVDSEAKAVLVCIVNGYGYEEKNNLNGGVKKVVNGYELIMTKFVNTCPIQENRYHLHVNEKGLVKVVQEEILMKDNACI